MKFHNGLVLALCSVGCTDRLRPDRGDEPGNRIEATTPEDNGPWQFDPESADAVFRGSFGRVLSIGGDVDGDGLDDVLISSADGVSLWYGPLDGDFEYGSAAATIIGPTDHLGWGAKIVGDVDGDGADDVLVDAFNDDEGGLDAGAAYLFHGPIHADIDVSTATVGAKLIGERPGDYVGIGVSSSGDVNGDGLTDLLITTSSYTSYNQGYLLYGPVQGDVALSGADARIFDPEVARSLSGLFCVGDVNGDGFDDVAASASHSDEGAHYAGAVRLLYGPIHGEIDLGSAQVGARLFGEGKYEYAGFSIAGGDLNGDGLSDLVVLSSGHNFSGAIYVLNGPLHGDVDLASAQAKIINEDASRNAFWIDEVTSAGDVNGDGYDDLLVDITEHNWTDVDGVYHESEKGSEHLVFFGPLSGLLTIEDADVRITGLAAVSYPQAGGGDVDGDGFDDLLVACQPEQIGVGETCLYYGGNGSIVRTVSQLEPGDLVVTEVMNNTAAVADADGEWFEVSNITPDTVVLTGLVVRDDDGESFVVGEVRVGPRARAVLGRNGDPSTNGGVAVDWAYGSAMYLGNAGDELVLEADGRTIDRVAWDDGATFPDLVGASMALDPAAIDAAANDDGHRWHRSGTAYGSGDLGTPGDPNDAP